MPLHSSTIVNIYNQEGLSGLYNGLSSSLVGIALTNGVYCESQVVTMASHPGEVLTDGRRV